VVKRVVVLGLAGQYPLAGMAWQVVHHLVGLRRLGFEPFYVENSGAPPYSPSAEGLATDAHANVRFLRDVFRRFDLAESWSYLDCLSGRWFGRARTEVQDWLEHADVILNLCGASGPDVLPRRKGCLVYLETDPVREQMKLARGDARARSFVEAHDVHFTYGWNLGTPSCPVPTGGIAWRKTHPPVVVDLWDAPPPRPRAAWRSIATYRNAGKDVEIDGRTYRWSKHPSFERIMSLPGDTRERLELALGAADGDTRRRFVEHGWSIVAATSISRGTSSYQRFVRGAKGEFSVEKEDQVLLCTGWFSDRSVCFLAAGRPCVLEDTGFGARVPTGEGLLGWRTREEARDALERVARDLPRHARRAREIAREHFEASVLLPPLLAAAGL